MDSLNLVTCPYNPCHQIRRERIQYHLLKCAKQHPHMDMVICPYNASHHVPREMEEEHIRECPDRRVVELQKYRYNQPGQHGDLSIPAVFGSASIPTLGEGSDDDDDVDTFSEREVRTSFRSRNTLRSGRHGRRSPLPPRSSENRRRRSRTGGEEEVGTRDSVDIDELTEAMSRQQVEGSDSEVEGLTTSRRWKDDRRRPLRRPTGDAGDGADGGAYARGWRDPSPQSSVSSHHKIKGMMVNDEPPRRRPKPITSSVRLSQTGRSAPSEPALSDIHQLPPSARPGGVHAGEEASRVAGRGRGSYAYIRERVRASMERRALRSVASSSVGGPLGDSTSFATTTANNDPTLDAEEFEAIPFDY